MKDSNQQKIRHFKQTEPDLFDNKPMQLSDKDLELQNLMFNNKSANRIDKKKKYYKNRKFNSL